MMIQTTAVSMMEYTCNNDKDSSNTVVNYCLCRFVFTYTRCRICKFYELSYLIATLRVMVRPSCMVERIT